MNSRTLLIILLVFLLGVGAILTIAELFREAPSPASMTPAIAADHKVLVGFKLGDLYPETFNYQQGERQGQIGISLKARLLKLSWVRIDGEPVALPPATEDQAA